MGTKWSPDGTRTCNPSDPDAITGSAEIVGAEKLETALGTLDVLKISATRRTARRESTFDETITAFWSTARDLELKTSVEWVNTDVAAKTMVRGTTVSDVLPAPLTN